MEQIIKKVFEEKMNDGTIEKIVAEHVEKMIHTVCESEMRWNGKAYERMKEKLQPLFIEAVEDSDIGVMLEKITLLINEGMKNSSIEEYAEVFKSTKDLFNTNDKLLASLKDKKTIKISEIFDVYRDFLENAFSESDFDEDDIQTDEGKYIYLEAGFSVNEREQRYFSYKPGYDVEFWVRYNDEEIEGTKADVRFRLEYDYTNTNLKVRTDFGSMSLFDLRYAPKFFVYLWAIERNYITVDIDTYEDSDEVHVDLE